MEWLQSVNVYWLHISRGYQVWSEGQEHWRKGLLAGVGDTFSAIDHTVLMCGAAIIVLGIIFWFSLRGRTDLR